MKECYVPRDFSPGSLKLIRQAEGIATDYAAQGYDLTLRQLYYQFVSRGLIPNKDAEYKRLGSVINDGRLAGLVDWRHITDRTRNLQSLSHWDDPAEIIRGAAQGYRNDLWANQEKRVEVWVEKEALAGVVARAANAMDTAYFACRGYVSASEMYSAAQRLRGYQDDGQVPVILHLGDHDPSGIDMTRDIKDRLFMLMCDPSDYRELSVAIADSCGKGVAPMDLDVDELQEIWDDYCFGKMPNLELNRVALNMDQVRRYAPPPNPAKLTDSRCEGYIRSYGNESWELDALDPATLDALIRTHIEDHLDRDLYEQSHAEQEEGRTLLVKVSDNWKEVSKGV